ncbi:MAG: hypothetical protein IPM54_25760 [Polyangiaceae bacterium]|nr:hypothetical protein [Polyangiaceae bacterium]
MIAIVLCGCEVERPPAVPSPPLPLARQIHQEALHEAPPPDIRVAERGLAEAIENFAIAVRLLETSAAPPSDDDLARTVELFAKALESIPNGSSVNAPAAAANMRTAVREGRSAGPPGSPPVRQGFAEALGIGIETLLELADGPYGTSRNVITRAVDLRSALYQVGGTTPPVDDGGRLSDVLRPAVFVMKAILEVRSEPPRDE